MELNQINLIGRLVDQPKGLKKNELKIANFSLANNTPKKNQKGENSVLFIDCFAFNKIAENIVKYCKKGDKIRVTGYLDVNKYKNTKGNEVTKYYIVVNECEFLTPKQAVKKDELTDSTEPF